jgi:membrane-bound metal-dependent hydrolase YbcI (DUF457 family)
MDSLTQIVLGAAVGELLLGRRLGNKAMLLGAIGGTLPDLDVIYNFFDDDPIAHLKVHRAYSHSLFTHIVLAWPLAWLSVRWRKLRDITFGRWYLFWFLALFTHALLHHLRNQIVSALYRLSGCLQQHQRHRSFVHHTIYAVAGQLFVYEARRAMAQADDECISDLQQQLHAADVWT